MKFIDTTEIIASSGSGGAGLLSFRRARNRPKLGPDGGNGGNGGNVILVADKKQSTLGSLRYRQHYKAEDGTRGGPNGRTGKCGQDLIITVPLGTIVYDNETNAKIAEVLDEHEQIQIISGGKRGYGNCAFVTPTRQAPQIATPGEKGKILHLKLELKLLADVGLAGFPNAGKSTLLSVISSAKPKIADYPFTTLTPNLGVVDSHDVRNIHKNFVIADIPGLIEGASSGKGLGHQFLKHLERCKLIVYVIEAIKLESPELSITKRFQLLKQELEAFSSKLVHKKSIIVINKSDLLANSKDIEAELSKLSQEENLSILQISAINKSGIKDLIFAIQRELEILNKETNTEEDTELLDFDYKGLI